MLDQHFPKMYDNYSLSHLQTPVEVGDGLTLVRIGDAINSL